MMDSFKTSKYFDKDANVISFIPHYTEKELKYLCFEYMNKADISLDDTLGSFNGRVGTAIATSYDIVRNCRFDVLVDGGSGYHTEKYQSIIREVVTSFLNRIGVPWDNPYFYVIFDNTSNHSHQIGNYPRSLALWYLRYPKSL